MGQIIRQDVHLIRLHFLLLNKHIFLSSVHSILIW